MLTKWFLKWDCCMWHMNARRKSALVGGDLYSRKKVLVVDSFHAYNVMCWALLIGYGYGCWLPVVVKQISSDFLKVKANDNL